MTGKLLEVFFRSSECARGRPRPLFAVNFLPLSPSFHLLYPPRNSFKKNANLFRDQREDLQKRLKELLKALRKAKLVCGRPMVIKARVPIIKCELNFGVAVDISLGAVNGAAAVEYIQAQVIWGRFGHIDFLVFQEQVRALSVVPVRRNQVLVDLAHLDFPLQKK